MKCPLQSDYTSGGSMRGNNKMISCIKEDCAWWLEDIQMYAIKDIALELHSTPLDRAMERYGRCVKLGIVWILFTQH